MKTYLNSDEKIQLGILLSFRKYLLETIKKYEESKKHKIMNKWLKTTQSFLTKAIDEMLAPVDAQNTEIALKAATKLKLVARTTDEALREIKQMRETDAVVSIPNEQFLFLCSFALTTCHTCLMTTFKECKLRDILMEYDIEPIHECTDQCQYQLKDIKDNACFHVVKNEHTGELLRIQPGINIKGLTRHRTAPITQEFWTLPKITAD